MVGYKLERLPSLTFFGDASSRDHEYMVLGGFAVAEEYIETIEAKIASLRTRAGIQSEFHWSAYRGGARKKAYFALVKYGFELVRNKYVTFHVLISPFKGIGVDHRSGYGRKKNASMNAAKDATINKLYRTLLIHRVARFNGGDRAIQVVLDEGNDSREVIKEAAAISIKAYKDYWGSHLVKPGSVRTMKAISSTESGIIQLADVIIGGISASREDRPLNQTKSELRDHITRCSGHPGWHINTGSDAREFTVWNHNRRHEWFLENKPKIKL